MRRSILISTMLAAIAALGACDPKPPEKPAVASPTPVATVSPAASPSVSPAKPDAKSEVKTTDGKNVNVNKEVKAAETPKAK